MLAPAEVQDLNRQFAAAPPGTVLEWAWARFGARAAIGTSFQGAGLVLMHLARQLQLAFPVFTLETGLLFPETVALKRRLEQFFGYTIQGLAPDLSVEQQAAAYGPDLWKRDPDLCCTIRKVLPLQDKLADLDCWITGLRRQQSQTRAELDLVELHLFDEPTGRQIVKLNPMAHWSREAVWQYVRQHQLPYNPLHDRGYHSIGCQPCTARAGTGTSERAGRWIGFNKTECGIHTFMARQA